MTKKELQIYISNLLRSYELKCKYGEPKLVSFENSILNPTLKLNTNKEERVYDQVLKNKSRKYRTLVRYEFKLREMRKQNISYEKIVKYLNSHKLSNQKIKYNKVYIYRFCQKKGIK
jgi:hypothetical protein